MVSGGSQVLDEHRYARTTEFTEWARTVADAQDHSSSGIEPGSLAGRARTLPS